MSGLIRFLSAVLTCVAITLSGLASPAAANHQGPCVSWDHSPPNHWAYKQPGTLGGQGMQAQIDNRAQPVCLYAPSPNPPYPAGNFAFVNVLPANPRGHSILQIGRGRCYDPANPYGDCEGIWNHDSIMIAYGWSSLEPGCEGQADLLPAPRRVVDVAPTSGTWNYRVWHWAPYYWRFQYFRTGGSINTVLDLDDDLVCWWWGGSTIGYPFNENWNRGDPLGRDSSDPLDIANVKVYDFGSGSFVPVDWGTGACSSGPNDFPSAHSWNHCDLPNSRGMRSWSSR